MNSHLLLLIDVVNGCVAHKVIDERTNKEVETGICTHLGYLLEKIVEKYGELDFDFYQDGALKA